MTTVVLFGGIVSLLGVTIWLGLLIWAAKGDGRAQRDHDRDAQRGQEDDLVRCTNCGRAPRPGESPDDDWRAESDGTGELRVVCPECRQREFGRFGQEG